MTSHWSEWPSSKNLQTINAGESVEKWNPLAVGGNVNWYSHYGEQYGGSLKKKKKWKPEPTISQFSSVTQSCPTLCDPMNLGTPSPTPGGYTDSCPLSWWCHPAISSSVIPFSSCPQSFPASGSFQISQLFATGSQSIGVSPLTSILPMNTQGWSPLGWTGWISLQSKGLSRVFSNTTVQKHQFFGAQLSS